MNNLMLRSAQVMGRVYEAVTKEQVWAARPWGHTTYQIEKFIFNDREYPRGPARFRQALRELWARWDAYWQVKDKYDELDHDLNLLAAEQERVRSQACLFAWQRMKRTADLGKLLWKHSQIERQRSALLLDLEHRIMPETFDILAVLEANAPSLDDTEAFSMKAERQVWEHRAKTEPKLREMLGTGEPSSSTVKI